MQRRVKIESVISSRYQQPGFRPVSWDERRSGIEKVRTADGDTLLLDSASMQSTPAPGWELMLKEPVLLKSGETAYLWTLYGLEPVVNDPKAKRCH